MLSLCPFEEILQAKEAEERVSLCLVMCCTPFSTSLFCVFCACFCLFFIGPFHYVNLCLMLSVSFNRQQAVCSLLHADTPAPPCSSHNGPPGFILTHCTNKQTSEKDLIKKPDRESRREVASAGIWTRSVSPVDLMCGNIWFKHYSQLLGSFRQPRASALKHKH